MFTVQCPHCQADLSVDSSCFGNIVACPKCQGTLLVPQTADGETQESDDDDRTPKWVIGLCFVVGHFALAAFLSVLWSFGAALFFVSLAAAIELAIWQRGPVAAFFRSMNTANRYSLKYPPADTVDGSAEPHRSDIGDSPRPAPSVTDDALVEVRTGSKPPPRQTSTGQRFWNRVSQLPLGRGRPLKGDLPVDNIYFYGVGTQLDLGRGVLTSALVYATGKSSQGEFDASLIDGTLPVAPPRSDGESRLPYWPSYYESTPEQRSRYLDWLLAGRCDSRIELGYVFIFFYGLERRAIVDDADHLVIAREILRLFPIYDRSNSFRSYASSLLWLTLYLASRHEDLPNELLEQALAVTGNWRGGTLASCLAIMANRNAPLPAEIAFLVGQHDSRSSSSVIVRRHAERFRELFNRKYESKFGPGLLLEASRVLSRIDYRAASPTLLRDTFWQAKLPEMPDVLRISSQFKPIVAIWEESITELRAFNRLHRSSGQEMSVEAFEALPEELRGGEHPEFDQWMEIWERHADADGWPLVPISALASLKAIDERNRLTKTQANRILTTADAIGIGVEPDARITGKNYRWDERVSLFFLEEDQEQDDSNYRAAAVLLKLGLTIAAADGHVDQVELDHITRHIEGQFNLTDNQSKRLHQLQMLLVRSEDAESSVGKVLCKQLPPKQRRLVGKFLVGVAAADEVITPEEIKSLRAAYRVLELREGELDTLLANFVPPNTSHSQGNLESDRAFRLDMDAVSRIMTETQQVSQILRDAMSLDEIDEEGDDDIAVAEVAQDARGTAMPSTGSDSTLPANGGLPARYQPFLQAVIAQKSWNHTDLQSLATNHNLMLSGAIEALNEWSVEQFGDWLIEEGDTFTVHSDLLTQNS